MTNETMLQRLEKMCECKYDIQIAAHMNSLKGDLKKDIEAAQKNKAETEPSTSDNKLKAEISADLKEAIGHICGGTGQQAIDHINEVLQKLSAVGSK